MSSKPGRAAETLGFLLPRVVVPLWVLTGATAKLIAASPRLLPKNIWTAALDAGVNLYTLLFVIIGLELFSVAVMVLLPRAARWMATWMLSVFCLVLVGEIVAGNTKCGCLGSVSPPPHVMLAIDGALLLGVLLFRRREDGAWLPRPRVLATALATALGFVVSALVILPQNATTEAAASPVPAATPGPTDAQAATLPASGGGATPAGSATPATGRSLPPYFALQDTATWTGKAFRDLPLAGFVDGWPADLGSGPRYVIFFSRSCDHCQMLLEEHFAGPPNVPTTLVAIPESKAGFTPDRWIDMAYCHECVGQLELPTGVDWLITPPLVFALVDGNVQCVKEADDPEAPECLIFG